MEKKNIDKDKMKKIAERGMLKIFQEFYYKAFCCNSYF